MKTHEETVRFVCKVCGQEVSGPDSASVQATVDRHLKESGHKQ